MRATVVHIVPHLRHGGAERMVVHLLNGLNPDRFQLSLIVLGLQSGSVLEKDLATNNIPVVFLNKRSGLAPSMFGRVHSALGTLRPDILHTHVHVLRYVLPSIMLRPIGVMIHTVHNMADYEVEPGAHWMQRLAFRNGIAPVAVSAQVAASLEGRYGIRSSPVISNCIPLEPFRSCRDQRASHRAELGLRSDDTVFICVALFRVQKNHALLLRAFADGLGRRHSNKLLLVGEGPTLADTKSLAAELGISSQVYFLGLRDDIPALLGASDVFVLASDFEGNPLAVMEAMAAGLPVVSTRAGGVPELLSDGCEGRLVPVRDRVGLAHALYQMNQEPVRRRMGAAARRRAERFFDVTRMVFAYETLYSELLDLSTPPGSIAAAADFSHTEA